MASEKFLSRIGKALGNAFSSTGDDAIRAAKKIVSNADDDILSFVRKNKMDLEDIFKKDAAFLNSSTDMMRYVGENSEKGATQLFSNKENFKNFLSSHYSDDTSKGFDNFIEDISNRRGVTKGISRATDLDVGTIKAIAKNKNMNISNLSREDISYFKNFVDRGDAGVKGSPVINDSVSAAANSVKGNSAPVVDPVGTHKQLKKARYGSMSEYKMFKESDRLEEGITAYNKKQYDNPILKEATEYINKIEETNLSPHELTKEQLNAYRNFSIGDSKTAEATFKDKLGYNQIPQKVTGVMSTAWLVNNLASRKGQQTNSELYNQQQQNQGYY